MDHLTGDMTPLGLLGAVAAVCFAAWLFIVAKNWRRRG